MCFTYEVLETFCNLPILAANPKNCLHRTPHFPMTSQRAHPTAPNPRHSMAQRRVRSKHHTCTTPQRRARAFPHHCTRPLHDAGYVLSHHAVPCLFATLHLCRSMAPCAYRPTAPYLRHTMLPSPTPLTVPRQVRSPPSALLQSCWKPGNKKVIKIATFLRLAIAADVQITNRTPKMKQNDRSVPHFHFTGDEKEPLIAKKLQKRQDFCFRKANCRNRSRFRNEPIAKRGGQIPR